MLHLHCVISIVGVGDGDDGADGVCDNRVFEVNDVRDCLPHSEIKCCHIAKVEKPAAKLFSVFCCFMKVVR